jgi:aspartokinase/homoserine dehydrogenase 1
MVITGYVASNTQGVATTLQRDGSDYSAAIMGRLLQSNNITIWTDVDGVLSADPRRVLEAHVIPEVSYNEAMELAYFGAKVIHPKTMQPAIMAHPQIPIYIRNTFNSSFHGTRIYTSSTTHTDRDKCVCGFSSIEKVALINVEGSGMMGVQGIARRLFGTLESIGINVILISQASSEHSITFATTANQAPKAIECLEDEFKRELSLKRISSIDVQMPCAIIAAVGDGMSNTSGVAGRFFSALGDAKINILAISQGCSERNISAVVFENESTRALRVIHAAFRLSHTVVRVGIVGVNDIGESLLKLLEGQRNKLRQTFELDLQVCAVAPDGRSSDLVITKSPVTFGVAAGSVTSAAYHKAMKSDPSKHSVSFISELDNRDVANMVQGGAPALCQHVLLEDNAHSVIFDCTAEEEVGKMHATWLSSGVNVVTANNTGLSGSQELRKAISDAESRQGKLSASYLHEVTVGGALPVLSTLRDLLNSGDKIRRVDGIFSVAMSYLMWNMSPPESVTENTNFDIAYTHGAFREELIMPTSQHPNAAEGISFSTAVAEAIALDLMEEDVVTDLSNEYTARILMVLAKELGIKIDGNVDKIQDASDKLVDSGTKVEDFKKLSADLDEQMKNRIAKANLKGCVLRHLGSVDVKTGAIEIKFVEVPHNHIFAITPPTCAIVRFFTERHMVYPLIVQVRTVST